MKEKWHDCGGGYQLYRRPNTSYCTFRSSLPINTALNNFNRNDRTTVKAINFIDVQTRVTARFEKASIWAASFSPSKFNYDRNLIRMNCLIMNLGTYGWLNTHLCRVFCDFKDIVLKSYLKWWKVNSDKTKFRFKDKNKILKHILYTFLKFLSLNVRGLRNREKRRSIFTYLKNQKANVYFLQETFSNSRGRRNGVVKFYTSCRCSGARHQ